MKNNAIDKNRTPALLSKRKALSSTVVLLLITIALFVILYVISIFMFQANNFAKFSVFFNLINTKAYLLLLTLGLMVVMITGSIDISVGGVTGLISMVIAVMLTENGVAAGWVIPVSLGIGLAFGVVQGFLVSYMEIQPFIVTLSGMFFARGMTSVLRIVSVPVTNETFMAWSSAKMYIPFLYNVRKNGTHDVAYLTPAAIIALVVLVIIIVLLKYTKFGRSLYAVGGNTQSAMLMGINAKRTKFMAHVLCGVLAGIGGLCFTLMTPAGNPANGRGYEIDAISSSVIGGAMLSGGVGFPIGALFGVLINALIQFVVPLLGIVEASWPRIISSAFLFLFIVLQSVLTSGKKDGGSKLPAWLRLKRKAKNNDVKS